MKLLCIGGPKDGHRQVYNGPLITGYRIGIPDVDIEAVPVAAMREDAAIYVYQIGLLFIGSAKIAFAYWPRLSPETALRQLFDRYQPEALATMTVKEDGGASFEFHRSHTLLPGQQFSVYRLEDSNARS